MQQAQGTTPQEQHCMHVHYNIFTTIIPTATWAARTMQAAHTVRPADQKPEYYRIARNFRGRKPSQISWFEANS